MHPSRRSLLRFALALVLPAMLAACAPAPIYKTGPAFVTATPRQVATAPGNFAKTQVVWGGKVIGVTNLSHSTEIRILAYPLDSSQRPRMQQPAVGRFIASVPGFLDPMNFPTGTLISVLGTLHGTSTGSVGQAEYVYPVVNVQRGHLHRWTPAEMRAGHPHISFGVGVGVGS